MPRVTSSNVLPRLQLTVDDVASLRATSAALEAEVVAQYERFIFRRRRQVDTSKWKAVWSSANLHAYQERANAVDTVGFPPPLKSSPLQPQAQLAAQSTCPRVLLTGTEAGTLDDAMYGCSLFDTASLRVHDAYQHDFLDDSAILCQIDGPTQEDPYRFLGLAWHLRGSRLGKDRDCLLLQQTRLTRLSTGECIGISIRHSVIHRDLPELLEFSTLRIKLSAITIYRQYSIDSIELFGLEFVDERRRGPDIFHIHESTRNVLACASECDTGFKKKLHWLMRRRHSQPNGGATHDPERPGREDCCALCSTSTSGLFSASGASCQLCTKYVCSRCLVTHEIVVDASTAHAVAKPFGFCVECILNTKKLPTLQVAQADLASRGIIRSGKSRRTTQSSRSTVSTSRCASIGQSHSISGRSYSSPHY